MNEFLTQYICPKELAKILDRLEHKYAMYIIKDAGKCASDEEAEEVYFLRRIRDVLCDSEI